MIMLFAFSVSAENEGYYTYTVENNEATITDVDESVNGDITIPSTLGGYIVRHIGNSAFAWCENIESITILTGITTIGDQAFVNCFELKNVKIADSVTYIDQTAFPNNRSIVKFEVDATNEHYSSDEYGVLFNKAKTHILKYPIGNKRTSYTIPDSVVSIGWCAFENTCLESIVIPDNVLSIGMYAFEHSNLSNITIGKGLRDIGEEAFACCKKLVSFDVDENNTTYSSDETGALFNKDKTQLIQYPIGNTTPSYDIPDSVTTIREWAFARCEGLKSITIPDSVIIIKWCAFSECTNLSDVTIGNNVKTIGSSAFFKCKSLEHITISDSVETIGSLAFYECINLEDIIIPDGVMTIDISAFMDCTNLEHITIPGSVTSIGVDAFARCTKIVDFSVDADNNYYSVDEYGVLFDKEKTQLLQYPLGNTRTSYNIPDSVTAILRSAFYESDNLEKITIPNSVTTIHDYAFLSCSKIRNIIIPDSVTAIGDAAFFYFHHIGYTGTEEQWNKIAFIGDNPPISNSVHLHFNFNPETDMAEVFTPSTCFSQGKKETVCSCGYNYIIESSPLADCSFGEYKSDNNATCLSDGTKTAYCVYGCGKKITVTDKGTALGHTDKNNDGRCDTCSEQLNKGPEDTSNIFSFIKEFFEKILDFFRNLFGIK